VVKILKVIGGTLVVLLLLLAGLIAWTQFGGSGFIGPLAG
jgi:hypothetical protein